jgi:heme-degrading monooxygenase HmoA
MFMASNQFKVIKGHESTFEHFWALKKLSFQAAPGFISCRFSRGRGTESHTLYFSLTVWENEESFLTWRYGRGDQREWVGVSAPDRSRLEEFDATIPRLNPQ